MKHELIKTENYHFVVSDEEIKENTPYLNDQVVFISDDVFDEGNNPNQNKENKKIIAHRPLNNALYLDGVDVLPEIEDDLHIHDAIGYAGSEGHPDPHAFSEKQIALLHGYVEGFEKAKETYKYTEEDLMNLVQKAHEIYSSGFGVATDVKKQDLIDFTKSLNQPKLPVAFEREVEVLAKEPEEGGGYLYRIKDGIVRGFSNTTLPFEELEKVGWTLFERPKTFKHSDGKTEWVGNYIF